MGRERRANTIIVLGSVLVVFAPLVGAGTAVAQEQFQGVMERIFFAGGSERRAFTIRVQAYTTDDEIEGLSRLLKEQGMQALQSRLTDLDLARLQFNGEPSVSIGFVRSVPTDEGGRNIRLVGRLRIAGGPARDWSTFSVIDLRLNENGTGTGEYFADVKIGFDSGGNLNFVGDGSQHSITTVEVR